MANYPDYFKNKKITVIGLGSSETHGLPTGSALPSSTGNRTGFPTPSVPKLFASYE